jgi:tRNA uridine 5-carboxymethylaminomethyl modification enzyme
MFTSRAEYRILLRQDNADFRLTEKSHMIGLASEERFNLMKMKKNQVDRLCTFLKNTNAIPLNINSQLKRLNTPELQQKEKLAKILLRPEINLQHLVNGSEQLNEFVNNLNGNNKEITESAEIAVKYESYINREKETAEKIIRLEYVKIPENFEFSKLLSLSTEATQKLNRIKPKNIGQASRIPGVSPSDINTLLVFFGR